MCEYSFPFSYIVFERRVAQKIELPDQPLKMVKLAAVIRGVINALRRSVQVVFAQNVARQISTQFYAKF